MVKKIVVKTPEELEKLLKNIEGVRTYPVAHVGEFSGVPTAYFEHAHPVLREHSSVCISVFALENIGYQDVKEGTHVWFSIEERGHTMRLLKGEELQKTLEI